MTSQAGMSEILRTSCGVWCRMELKSWQRVLRTLKGASLSKSNMDTNTSMLEMESADISWQELLF